MRRASRFTDRETRVLQLLYDNRGGAPVPTSAIIGAIWPNPDDEPESAAASAVTLISSIRRKVEPLGCNIATHYRMGFRLVRRTPRTNHTPTTGETP